MTRVIASTLLAIAFVLSAAKAAPTFSKAEARTLGRALSAQRLPLGEWVPVGATAGWCNQYAPVGEWARCRAVVRLRAL